MTDNEIITDNEILRAWDFSKMVAINIGSVTLDKSEVVAINGLLNRQMYEIKKLTVELQAMRGAANSYKMHYENARAEIERLRRLLEQEEKATNSLAKKCYKDGATDLAKMLCEGRVSNDPVVIVTKSVVKEFTEERNNAHH